MSVEITINEIISLRGKRRVIVTRDHPSNKYKNIAAVATRIFELKILGLIIILL